MSLYALRRIPISSASDEFYQQSRHTEGYAESHHFCHITQIALQAIAFVCYRFHFIDISPARRRYHTEGFVTYQIIVVISSGMPR